MRHLLLNGLSRPRFLCATALALGAGSVVQAQTLPPAAAGPGAFEVTEEDVTRALERALVVEGAETLPPGVFQVEPGFSFVRQEDSTPILIDVAEGPDEEFVAGERRVERNVFSSSVTLRAGLPADFQLDFLLPYRFEDTSTSEGAGFVFGEEAGDSDNGFGDFRLGLTKALVQERDAVPSVLARVFWDSDTGEGDTFNELGATLTAVKSQDPLVFIGSFSYEHAFEDNDVEPGDTFGFSAGVALAITPETSWRITFDQDFEQDARVDGDRIEGSDRTLSSLSFAVSTIVARDALLDVEVGVGLSNDAPDYFVAVSLPIRFSTGLF